MIELEKHLGADSGGWRELLSEFVRVRDVLQATAVESWRGLLVEFTGARDALQVAIGQPSASRCTFNVLDVTRRRGFEVTTHSALLRELLDPRGSHGQGGAFLNAFLAVVDGNLLPGVVRSPWPPADGWWRVTVESRTDEGRLDIVLANRRPPASATIVIENKWDSGPGERQLERYGVYLAKLERSEQPHRTCLVYLTRKAEDHRPRVSVDLVCLSHSVHMVGLIQDVLTISQDHAPPALREPLLQYCAILDDDNA